MDEQDGCQSQQEEKLDIHGVIYNLLLLQQSKMVRILLILLTIVVSCYCAGAPGCHHPIFCNDQILTAVANSNFYPDSKTFVDLVLKVSVEQALVQFQTKRLDQFLQNCFTTNNKILIQVNLTDWKPNPEPLAHITKPQLKSFTQDLNKRWNQLARRVDLNYKTNCRVQCSSFLEIMNGRVIIVPGGRFQESYYWDTYWIVIGLITCDLLDTAEGLIENFIMSIEKYGFIPNGCREYYLNRSQPPFFALMVSSLVQAFRDKKLEQRAKKLEEKTFPSLVKQHEFFMSSHAKTFRLKSQKWIFLNFYNANTTTPRPQSFREDMKLVQNVTNETEKKRILKGISSMAQSGWDFSSRWLTNSSDLKTTVIEDIFPSDLNTLMALDEIYLASLAEKFQRRDLQQYFLNLADGRRDYFSQVFNGVSYPDYSKVKQRKEGEVYPSDFYPFFLFGRQAKLIDLYKNVVNPVSSPLNNGMQWDYPNVWAPNNWIMHEVLGKDEERFQIAQQWVSTVYCSWKKEALIYEKYRLDKLGERGQGGEYAVQSGFGWTNGLALHYLKIYGDKLQVPNCP